MRYLVHRGTGTILGADDDLVIVDLDDSVEQDEEDILELADNVPAWNKAIVLRSDECPVRLSDEIIFSELNDYVCNWEDALGNDDDYFYCVAIDQYVKVKEKKNDTTTEH